MTGKLGVGIPSQPTALIHCHSSTDRQGTGTHELKGQARLPYHLSRPQGVPHGFVALSCALTVTSEHQVLQGASQRGQIFDCSRAVPHMWDTYHHPFGQGHVPMLTLVWQDDILGGSTTSGLVAAYNLSRVLTQ